MPTSSLQAKANTGAGTDNIAGITVAEGFVGAGMLTDNLGADITAANPLPAAATQVIDTAGFSAVGSSVLDAFFNAPIVGTGVTYNQGAGALNILSGTTTNAEFLARSVRSYTGSMRIRSSHILSQRIVNNNFALLLADQVAAGAAYTIVSATVVNVTVTAHGWTSQMVGQFMLLGGITGAAGVPGRYALASIVDANTLQFTVAGWPGSGSGTLTVFGRNYLRQLFTGTTATNVNWDVQRNGWATGDTVATINTTASPGTVLMSELTGREALLADKLRATSLTPNVTLRAFRDENIPEPTSPLFVFLWSFNGTTAPASTTTWTLGHIAIEEFPNQSVYIQGVRAQGFNNPLPVVFPAAQPVSGTLTAVTTVTTLANGQTAHDSAITGSPHRIGGRAVTANYTAVAAGDAADLITTTVGAQITKPYAIPEVEWSFTGALTTTSDVVVQTAAAAGLKRHVTWIQATNTGASAVDVLLRDGTTTRLQVTIPAAASVDFALPTGIPLTAATALNVQLSAAGTVRFNALGYTAP
jgi:hypothetical protein